MENLANKQVGQFIREKRLEKGLEQKDVAKAIGVDTMQIHRYEHGRQNVSFERLSQIMNFMKIKSFTFKAK